MRFICIKFTCQTVQFDPLIGSYQVLPHRAIVDMGAMTMKGIPFSPKLQNNWSLTIRMFTVIYKTLVTVVVVVGSYATAGMMTGLKTFTASSNYSLFE